MASPPTTPSGARFWIKASPRGTRSGFAVLPDGEGGNVTITVLPKPWAPKTGAVREYTHVPGSTTHVVMYESELLALRTSIASIGALTMGLAASSEDQANLLELGSPPRDLVTASPTSGDSFHELINLMLLAERGRLTTSPLSFQGTFAPTLLRLLTYERLVQTVESVIFRVRLRYTERTEVLSLPRGRISEHGLLFSLKTGTPRLESTFDELTIDTPLLQVVAAALQVVASERLPPRIAELRPNLQSRAVHLLRQLTGVRLIERESAALMAERLWLGQLDRVWKPALDAAAPVLRGRAVIPQGESESSTAFSVQVETEKFWEQCVEMALRAAFTTVSVSRDGDPGEGVHVPAPWIITERDDSKQLEPASERFPDYMFRVSKQIVVADAKYKLGGESAPNSGDGYQLFAYSHLARLDEQDSDFALIISPAREGNSPRQLQLERLRDRKYPLWLVRLPFPSRADIQTQASWSIFIEKLAQAITDFSAEWVAR